MAPELTTGLVLVLFAGLLSALTYITVRRSRETSDRDVAALQATDQRAEVSRKRLHEGIEDIRTHFVHKKECTQKHQQMSEQRREFMAAALKLGKPPSPADVADALSVALAAADARRRGTLRAAAGKHKRR